MDLMTGGELFDRIVSKDHYSEVEAKDALKQIAIAIKYCHDQNIVHRDLKPENILYATPDNNSVLKVADFGLACLLKPNELMYKACGTPGYVAPEVLRGVAYGKEVDMWSIGVILYILLCGFPPFYDDSNKRLYNLIVTGSYSFPDPYWSDVSENAKDLVKKLLVIDPTMRLTADELLQHPWLIEEQSSTLELPHFKSSMKAYNARRRLRATLRAVQITQFLNSELHSYKDKTIKEIMTGCEPKSVSIIIPNKIAESNLIQANNTTINTTIKNDTNTVVSSIILHQLYYLIRKKVVMKR